MYSSCGALQGTRFFLDITVENSHFPDWTLHSIKKNKNVDLPDIASTSRCASGRVRCKWRKTPWSSSYRSPRAKLGVESGRESASLWKNVCSPPPVRKIAAPVWTTIGEGPLNIIPSVDKKSVIAFKFLNLNGHQRKASDAQRQEMNSYATRYWQCPTIITKKKEIIAVNFSLLIDVPNRQQSMEWRGMLVNFMPFFPQRYL